MARNRMRPVAVLWVTAVMSTAVATRAEYAGILIAGVPHVEQKPDFCGEACAEMWLAKLGKRWTQNQVFTVSGLDPSLGRGCYTSELVTALKQIGLTPGTVWYPVATNKLPEQTEAQWKALHTDLASGVPSIVCMHYDDRPGASEHFRLILGYDPKTDEVLYHEPAAANGTYKRMKRALFEKLWPLKVDDRTANLIRMRLAADKIEDPPARRSGFTPADFAQHVMAMKKQLPTGFTVVVQPPFVVVGDEQASVVRRRATDTVKWAADRLKQEYFARDPAEILDIWLFKDEASYRKYAKELFGDNPDTPFGYFSATHKALIMNIATGGGTLVHEIVHPFIRANFPKCPAWLNEGLGSLYEQSTEREGHIRGLTNWRLAGLQEAIEKGTVPSFKDLTAMNDDQFYHRDRGTNYAQSRYLCYYLQEKGLLARFYKEFLAHAKDDPSGYKTLVSILGEKDMDAFKTRWEAYVTKLHFP
jgi:hypothetical protein